MGSAELQRLEPGQQLVYGGNRIAEVSPELAAAFAPGDRIVVDPKSGDVLHIRADVHRLTADTVAAAERSFSDLAACSDDQISSFFTNFADRLAAPEVVDSLLAANSADVDSARRRGRSVTRLVLDDKMLAGMIDGLRGWAAVDGGRSRDLDAWVHPDWTVRSTTAPLGVIGFVFEGRPNVFADAAGVVRTGNSAVFRIGSDALATARAMMEHAVRPALAAAGLPSAALALLDSPAHAAGWALFSDQRVALAVARGSGPAVAQLGSVARSSGVAVSLHGTGGAWLLVDETVAPQRVTTVVEASLDRKVCNTLNTVCVTANCDDAVLLAIVEGARAAAATRGASARLHVTERAAHRLAGLLGSTFDERVQVTRADGTDDEPFATPIAVESLGEEWEWEESPELSIHIVDDLDEAVTLFNTYSPSFVASVLTTDDEVYERCYASLDAPFFGNGMTRWVDGQFALNAPELGLSNWQFGRMLTRGGILSGDGIYTIRYRADIPGDLRR